MKAAAARAGLPAAVSAHYLRHAHVGHALDRGAPGAPGAGDRRALDATDYGYQTVADANGSPGGLNVLAGDKICPGRTIKRLRHSGGPGPLGASWMLSLMTGG